MKKVFSLPLPWHDHPLLGLDGVSGLVPFHPAAFQSPYLRKPQLQQVLRHPGAGALILSGAVQDDFLILGKTGSFSSLGDAPEFEEKIRFRPR
jgi:hypothetical protein